jgi:hypothetical protein
VSTESPDIVGIRLQGHHPLLLGVNLCILVCETVAYRREVLRIELTLVQ